MDAARATALANTAINGAPAIAVAKKGTLAAAASTKHTSLASGEATLGVTGRGADAALKNVNL